MGTVSRETLAILDAVNDLEDAATLDELGQVFRQHLGRLLPADVHEIVVFPIEPDAEGLFLATPGGLTPEERETMLGWLAEHPGGHPVAREILIRGHGPGSYRVSDLAPLREWRESEFYDLFNRRLGHDYELDGVLPEVRAGTLSSISCSRGGRDFSLREVAIFDLMLRPVARGLRRLMKTRGVATEDEAARIGRVLPQLTRRECEVLHWICEGNSDSEIASILGQSPHTTHTHVRNLLRKLGARSRLEAAMRVMRGRLA